MNKRLFPWQAALLFLVFLLTGASALAESAPRISTDELNARLGDSDIVILDVRGSWDWNPAENKIAGAERVDPRAVNQWLGQYPKEKTIVLYCA